MRKTILLSFFILMAIFLLVSCKQPEKTDLKTAVDEEYAYNTDILKNPNAVSEGEAVISGIKGYKEGAVEGLTLPYRIPDTELEIVSVGAYTGAYVEDSSMDEVKDLFSVVVRNTSVSTLSYAAFEVQYSENVNLTCGFSCSNLKPGRSALLLCEDKKLKFDSVTRFVISSHSEIAGEDLVMLDGVVGVDYQNGSFIITNLTEDSLGTVYIRFKYLTDGNAYLGGTTLFVSASYISRYETAKIDAGDFDPDLCEIICVENDENTVVS